MRMRRRLCCGILALVVALVMSAPATAARPQGLKFSIELLGQ